MANVQKQFEKFHAVIRTDYDMNSDLRSARDTLVSKVRNNLKKHEENRPRFHEINQGSYIMRTGVIPDKDVDYDIDVGLVFHVKSEDDYSAKEIRGWVYDAVEDHTADGSDNKPNCIRVPYRAGYHVDLVTYCSWTDAAGKEHIRLGHKSEGWRPADPDGLKAHVDRARERFTEQRDGETGTDQFGRLVRYLKRWNDRFFKGDSSNKPTGLAFTIAAVDCTAIPCTRLDGTADDLEGLRQLAESILQRFQGYGENRRASIKKPTPEYEDLLAKLSAGGMARFEERMKSLRDDLIKAGYEPDPVKACEILVGQFGEDFPVPPKEETGRRTAAPAIVSSSSSA